VRIPVAPTSTPIKLPWPFCYCSGTLSTTSTKKPQPGTKFQDLPFYKGDYEAISGGLNLGDMYRSSDYPDRILRVGYGFRK
jgi:hypothetical protein